MTERIQIEGMSCGHCVSRVRTALEGVEGVEIESVQIGEAVVSLPPHGALRGEIVAAIQAAGYAVG